ncbi:hypothetical protein [Glutamicibacter sp.]|uniref:hypothetical protein n=1 Tax=Glutamicibacter sp. TaxID=1931995 RepID=UPI003D6AED56
MNSLPCGRTTEDVLMNLDESADLHELQCRWCHAERQRLKDQNGFITQLLQSSTPEHHPEAFSQRILGEIADHSPFQRMWDVQEAGTGLAKRVSSLDLIKAIRAVFSESTTSQLNYTEIKATDTQIPHLNWRVQCHVSMAGDSSVQVIEQQVLGFIRDAISPLISWNELVVNLAIEDIHGQAIESLTLREKN